jgi:hypothetical protein
MFLKWTILTFTVAFLTIGCFSKAASGKDLELLTGSPWKYEKAGFGNDDGVFDALDPRIAGSEKENMIIFCKDGTGYSQYQHKSRNGNPDSLPFMWAFQNDDSTIYFQDQYYKVRTLSPKRLEIYADQRFGGVSTRYTIVFIH